jgi:hypothetical protein
VLIQEYLQYLEVQPTLSDLKCDLSLFERWEGDGVFEIQMMDEMIDEMAGGRAGCKEDVGSEKGDGNGDKRDYDASMIVLSV